MYLTSVKAQIVQALRSTLDADFFDPEYRDTKIDIEFPVKMQDYPSIWVSFDPTGPLLVAGIGHHEFIDENAPTPIQELYRWRYTGRATFTCVALSSFELDRLIDLLVSVFAFSRMGVYATFREMIESNPLVGMDANWDEIDQVGFTASQGTPWGTDDMVYEGTLALDIIGEFVSGPTGEFFPLESIVVEEWVLGAPDPTEGEEGWLREVPPGTLPPGA